MTKSKRFADMTGKELRAWYLGEQSPDSSEASFQLIRDAILAEAIADAEVALNMYRTRAERAESDLSRSRDAHNVAIRERDVQRVVSEECRQQLATLRSQVEGARREGAREALTKCEKWLCLDGIGIDQTYGIAVGKFRDLEYPAIASAPRVPDLACPAKVEGDADCICKPIATPPVSAEPLVVPVEDTFITITPALAAEIVKMGGKV